MSSKYYSLQYFILLTSKYTIVYYNILASILNLLELAKVMILFYEGMPEELWSIDNEEMMEDNTQQHLLLELGNLSNKQ